MKLLTIIVNYKTAEMTIRAIEAALKELASVPHNRLVVVDNDSGDGSFAKLQAAVSERAWGDRVEILASDRNGGFGYGNNFAIRRALASSDPPDYVYLLNSDAFPDPACISNLVDFMDRHPHAGIAGSYVHGTDGEPHETAFRFPTVYSELETALRLGVVSKLLHKFIVALPIPTETTEVDWLAGASMIIRRTVLEEVGLFDETFFLYFEETDLCRRAKLAGWPTYYVPTSKIAHIGSASTGMKDTQRRTPGYWFDSRQHYFRKNYGDRYLTAANVAWLAGYSVWRVRRRVQGKPDTDPPHLLRDFVKNNFRLK